MLTIFSTPKPFRGHFKKIQLNAVQSWAAIRPACEILLMGDEEGTEEAAKMVGARYLPEITRNEFGTPLVCSLFEQAQKAASNDLLCFSNADIIFFDDLVQSVRMVNMKSFLLTGRRIDFECGEPIDFSDPTWSAQLRADVNERGVLHPPTGADFFLFSKNTFLNIPPFAIGRPVWDNWIIYEARRLKIPVVDATGSVVAIHQNHDYSHHHQGAPGVWEGPEANKNLGLVGYASHDFHLLDATWLLSEEGLRRAWTPAHIRRHLHTLPLFYPWLRPISTTVKRMRNSLMKSSGLRSSA